MVGRDSEFAHSADLSTRILRFGNLEAEGGLRKILPIKLRGTNIVEKKRQKGSPTKGLAMVRSSFSIKLFHNMWNGGADHVSM